MMGQGVLRVLVWPTASAEEEAPDGPRLAAATGAYELQGSALRSGDAR